MSNTDSGPAAAGSYFLFRLVPPRATFPDDITTEESAAMARHFAYWADRARERQAVVYGPVKDPKGVWGLAVVEAPDERAAYGIQAADPIIQSQLGFRYEIFPMLNAVLRT